MSWKEAWVRRLLEYPGMARIRGGMCSYTSGPRQGLARIGGKAAERQGWATNSELVAKVVAGQRGGSHKQGRWSGGCARAGERYSDELVKRICAAAWAGVGAGSDVGAVAEEEHIDGPEWVSTVPWRAS